MSSDEKAKMIDDMATPVYTRIAFYGFVDGKEVLLHLTDVYKGFVAVPDEGDVVILSTALDQPCVENKRMIVSSREYTFLPRPYEVFIRIHCDSFEQNGPSFWTDAKK
mgnify:FL=1